MQSKNQSNLYLYLLLFHFCLIQSCNNPAEVSITNIPAYPCKGDDVSILYETRNIDRIKVWDDNNNVLHQSRSRSGNFTISNIDESMLPLKAKGWQDDESDTKYIGPNHDYVLRVIDDEITTNNFELTTQITQVPRFEDTGLTDGCCCVYQGTEDVVCDHTFSIVNVYETMEGKYEIISESLFAERARITKVHNNSDFKLNVELRGASFQIESGDAIDISAMDLKPGGRVTARFNADEYLERFLGVYADIQVKSDCCQAGYIERNAFIRDREIKLAFSLICNQNQ